MNKIKKIRNIIISSFVLYLLSTESFKLIKGDIKANEIISNHKDNHIENIVAHRGFSGLYRENSLESIKKASELDCVDMIEIDIRFTNNNVFVLHHDSVINIEEIAMKIEDLNLDDDLEELIIDNYSSYDISDFLYDDTLFLHKRFLNSIKEKDKIIRLFTVLNVYDFSKPLILDIKTNDVNVNMIEELNKLLINYKNNIFIQSSYYPFLNKMMELYPDYKYLYIINSNSSIKNQNNNFYGYTVKYSLLNKLKINKDKLYFIYTINSKQKYLNLINNKNYSENMYVITDNPDYICAISEEKKLRK